MGTRRLVHRITLSPTLHESGLLAVDNTSAKELADVALAWVMSLAANALLTFLWGEIYAFERVPVQLKPM